MGEKDIAALVEMGFPRNRAEKAIIKTKDRGMQAALDWLVEHSDDPDIDEPVAEAVGKRLDEPSAQTDEDATPEIGAKSFICEECNKTLRDSAAVQLHAARTGHENFAESTVEIKPLTEEEKKEQLIKLKAKLEEKRKERERLEKEELLTKEIDRRKQGRVGQEVQQKFQEQAQMKLLEEEKRKRAEEKAYKEKLRQQLEQDKAERQARKNKQPDMAAAPSAIPTTSVNPISTPVNTSNYTECRVQVRLPNNGVLSNSFNADDTLQSVIKFVQEKRTDGQGSFSLMTTFNRKTYTADDYSKTLRELGLLPSVAFVCKNQ